jgi:hypothetical protein
MAPLSDLSSQAARLAGAACLLIASTGTAPAHHPGSHAYRQPDGQVRLEIAAMAGDSCTRIASVEPGAPSGLRPPPGSEPVTVRLTRPQAAVCATVVSVATHEAILPASAKVTHLHLYILAPDGRVQGSERVPVR